MPKESFFVRLKLKLETLEITWHTEDVIQRLANDMEYLQKNDLSLINDRLMSQSKVNKFSETLIEIAIAVHLRKLHADHVNSKFSYEPDTDGRRIDLEISLNNITYLLQIKSECMGERENRQAKLIRHIEAKAKQIPVSRFFDVELSNNFDEHNFDKLMEFFW